MRVTVGIVLSYQIGGGMSNGCFADHAHQVGILGGDAVEAIVLMAAEDDILYLVIQAEGNIDPGARCERLRHTIVGVCHAAEAVSEGDLQGCKFGRGEAFHTSMISWTWRFVKVYLPFGINSLATGPGLA